MLAAVSFDVWGTLLKIDVIYRRLAKAFSAMNGLDPFEAERTIYSVYNKLKELRLYIDEPDDVRAFPLKSRSHLAKALRMSVEDVSKAVDMVLMSIEPSDLIYEDVRPTIETLQSLGMKMGVTGNTVFWESTYTREILDRLDLKRYFVAQIYSDEVGIFKPDKRIFQEFCKRLGVEPSKVLHVGDNVVEDLGGALSASMGAVLIDRHNLYGGTKIVLRQLKIMITQSLTDVIEAIQVLG